MKKIILLLLSVFMLSGCLATEKYVNKQVNELAYRVQSLEEEVKQLYDEFFNMAERQGGYLTRDQAIELVNELINKLPMGEARQANLILKLLELSEANKIRAFTETEGGGTGALDAVACANLAENDLALVYDVNSTTMLFFWFDDGATDAEDTTNYTVMRPDDYASCGDGVWKLFASFLFAGTATPATNYKDSDQSHQTIAKIYANANDANDSYIYFQVEVDTALVTFITFDGVNEEVTFGKPIDMVTNSITLGGVADPSTTAEGQFNWDNDDDFLEVYNGSTSVTIPTIECWTYTIAEPDEMDGIEDEVVLRHFMAEHYPHGWIVTSFAFTASANVTDDDHNLEHWDDRAGTTKTTIDDSAAFSNNQRVEDDGTLSSATVPTDGYLVIDLDDASDDVGTLEITVCGYTAPGN